MGGSVRSGRTAGAAWLPLVVLAAGGCTVPGGDPQLHFRPRPDRGREGTLDVIFRSAQKAIIVKGSWDCSS
jgi:hypothetical protein